MKYISTRGRTAPVGFDQALLEGFAEDGGLFVPSHIPHFSQSELEEMASLSYTSLAQRVIRPYIPASLIPEEDLTGLLNSSFHTFETEEITPVVKLNDAVSIQELFHGPTLSFKDIAMGFLINCMDYFLTRNKERLSLVLATTGDTGPAAAHAAAGKSSLECWPLYPLQMISEEQERQMTTLRAGNVHPVGVTGCKNGGDDLDLVVARLFADRQRKTELKISSVNSINWCRVMVQTVHYFYGYFQVANRVGDPVSFSVPAGAFGNLCAGYFARAMGLPIKNLICATNSNGTLHRIFSDGLFSKRDLVQTLSSAIDIVVPYNFWRFLYYNCGSDPEQLRAFMDTFESTGELRFPKELWSRFAEGFLSTVVTDEETLGTISRVHDQLQGYLLDPHGAVAVAAHDKLGPQLQEKVICLATAHPAKFADVIRQAIPGELPQMATHPAIEKAKSSLQYLASCNYNQLENALCRAMAEKI